MANILSLPYASQLLGFRFVCSRVRLGIIVSIGKYIERRQDKLDICANINSAMCAAIYHFYYQIISSFLGLDYFFTTISVIGCVFDWTLLVEL